VQTSRDHWQLFCQGTKETWLGSSAHISARVHISPDNKKAFQSNYNLLALWLKMSGGIDHKKEELLKDMPKIEKKKELQEPLYLLRYE